MRRSGLRAGIRQLRLRCAFRGDSSTTKRGPRYRLFQRIRSLMHHQVLNTNYGDSALLYLSAKPKLALIDRMARLARIVVPGLPHHVTQRGNGRAKVFFTPGDYELYRDLLVEHCRAAGVGIWAWCLMPHHVHLILTPTDPDGLRRALAKVHRIYAGIIHARQRKTGHFWQGRFGAVAMDEDHMLSALRYVGLNPVRAGLVEKATDWPWSSARAHVMGESDGVTDVKPMQDRLPSPAGLFDLLETDVAAFEALRKAESIGRPVGDEAFLDRVAGQIGKAVKVGKRGRRRKEISVLSP